MQETSVKVRSVYESTSKFKESFSVGFTKPLKFILSPPSMPAIDLTSLTQKEVLGFFEEDSFFTPQLSLPLPLCRTCSVLMPLDYPTVTT